MGKYIFDYDSLSFTLEIPDYWINIYNGKPREQLYHDYKVMLDLLKKVDKNKWVLDIGANHGIFAVPASMLGYKVVCFEPVDSNYNNLIEAEKANNLVDFYIYHFALSNYFGMTDIYVPECPDNSSLNKEAAIANMIRKDFIAETVDCIRFDEWIKNNPFYSDIGFIKLDVQGAEYIVLEGMEEFLTRATDIQIVVEYENHLNKMGYTFQQLDKLITSYGFIDIGYVTGGDKLWVK